MKTCEHKDHGYTCGMLATHHCTTLGLNYCQQHTIVAMAARFEVVKLEEEIGDPLPFDELQDESEAE